MSGNIGKPLQHPANDAELGKRDSAESSSSGAQTRLQRYQTAIEQLSVRWYRA
jgi:hypothetical protein